MRSSILYAVAAIALFGCGEKNSKPRGGGASPAQCAPGQVQNKNGGCDANPAPLPGGTQGGSTSSGTVGGGSTTGGGASTTGGTTTGGDTTGAGTTGDTTGTGSGGDGTGSTGGTTGGDSGSTTGGSTTTRLGPLQINEILPRDVAGSVNDKEMVVFFNSKVVETDFLESTQLTFSYTSKSGPGLTDNATDDCLNQAEFPWTARVANQPAGKQENNRIEKDSTFCLMIEGEEFAFDIEGEEGADIRRLEELLQKWVRDTFSPLYPDLDPSLPGLFEVSCAISTLTGVDQTRCDFKALAESAYRGLDIVRILPGIFQNKNGDDNALIEFRLGDPFTGKREVPTADLAVPFAHVSNSKSENDEFVSGDTFRLTFNTPMNPSTVETVLLFLEGANSPFRGKIEEADHDLRSITYRVTDTVLLANCTTCTNRVFQLRIPINFVTNDAGVGNKAEIVFPIHDKQTVPDLKEIYATLTNKFETSRIDPNDLLVFRFVDQGGAQLDNDNDVVSKAVATAAKEKAKSPANETCTITEANVQRRDVQNLSPSNTIPAANFEEYVVTIPSGCFIDSAADVPFTIKDLGADAAQRLRDRSGTFMGNKTATMKRTDIPTQPNLFKVVGVITNDDKRENSTLDERDQIVFVFQDLDGTVPTGRSMLNDNSIVSNSIAEAVKAAAKGKCQNITGTEVSPGGDALEYVATLPADCSVLTRGGITFTVSANLTDNSDNKTKIKNLTARLDELDKPTTPKILAVTAAKGGDERSICGDLRLVQGDQLIFRFDDEINIKETDRTYRKFVLENSNAEVERAIAESVSKTIPNCTVTESDVNAAGGSGTDDAVYVVTLTAGCKLDTKADVRFPIAAGLTDTSFARVPMGAVTGTLVRVDALSLNIELAKTPGDGNGNLIVADGLLEGSDFFDAHFASNLAGCPSLDNTNARRPEQMDRSFTLAAVQNAADALLGVQISKVFPLDDRKIDITDSKGSPHFFRVKVELGQVFDASVQKTLIVGGAGKSSQPFPVDRIKDLKKDTPTGDPFKTIDYPEGLKATFDDSPRNDIVLTYKKGTADGLTNGRTTAAVFEFRGNSSLTAIRSGTWILKSTSPDLNTRESKIFVRFESSAQTNATELGLRLNSPD